MKKMSLWAIVGLLLAGDIAAHRDIGSQLVQLAADSHGAGIGAGVESAAMNGADSVSRFRRRKE